ncbi:MAG: PleD family two-component system response regulator [Rickettsiaceae bacterium]|nr:PleD family two-component system response regulator [Rickettsiaceae bacterium]
MTAQVLIVDDLEPNLRILEAKLLMEYYTVLTATSGAEAIEILKKEKIDIILLDVMMPDMDGFETCKKIKENPETAQIPVIMVTALSEIEDRIKGLESGVDEFLTKPINDTALLARVKSLSRIKAMMDELKMRNQTIEELGENIIEFDDKFHDCEILIIDDDVVQYKNLSKTLFGLTQKIRVISAIDDLENLEENYSPDVIIISCHLENEDPLRVVVSLRAKDAFRYSSFVLMTDEDDMSMVIKAMDLGVSDYFSYPVNENELVARIKTQLRRKRYQDSLRDGLDKSVRLSIKDSLSGVYNRRYFHIHLNRMIQKALRLEKGLALLMFDLDYFKTVNDTYGHQAGDIVIKGFAEILKNSTRVTDLIARYGGEEFAAAIYDVSITEAIHIAERIRDQVERYEFVVPNLIKPLSKTVSIGVGYLTSDMDGDRLIQAADQALYEAKETGRNKVCVYDQ